MEKYNFINYFHGKHVSSKYEEKIYYYNSFFTKDQIYYLKNIYSDILKEFDYDWW